MTTMQERIAELLMDTASSDSLELAENLAPALLASCLVASGKDTSVALELASDFINKAAARWQEDTNE